MQVRALVLFYVCLLYFRHVIVLTLPLRWPWITGTGKVPRKSLTWMKAWFKRVKLHPEAEVVVSWGPDWTSQFPDSDQDFSDQPRKPEGAAVSQASTPLSELLNYPRQDAAVNLACRETRKQRRWTTHSSDISAPFSFLFSLDTQPIFKVGQLLGSGSSNRISSTTVAIMQYSRDEEWWVTKGDTLVNETMGWGDIWKSLITCLSSGTDRSFESNQKRDWEEVQETHIIRLGVVPLMTLSSGVARLS